MKAKRHWKPGKTDRQIAILDLMSDLDDSLNGRETFTAREAQTFSHLEAAWQQTIREKAELTLTERNHAQAVKHKRLTRPSVMGLWRKAAEREELADNQRENQHEEQRLAIRSGQLTLRKYEQVCRNAGLLPLARQLSEAISRGVENVNPSTVEKLRCSIIDNLAALRVA